MRVFHHMRELEEALRDWERYQRIPEGQFLQDPGYAKYGSSCHVVIYPVGNRHSDRCDCRRKIEEALHLPGDI